MSVPAAVMEPPVPTGNRLQSTIRRAREALLRTAYAFGTAIILPYCVWDYWQEWNSFSRIPVTAGVLLLCVVAGFLYFATTIRFRFRFSWKSTLWAAALFGLLGIGFGGILSIICFSYLYEIVAWLRTRRGGSRPTISPNTGLVLVGVLGFVVFPLLNEMYFRGAQVKVWSPDYNRQNIFYQINRDGFRGPRVPVARTGKPRLLFLGDSSPFGWPYRYRESFPFVVQDVLHQGGTDVEVVNAATIGQSLGEMRAQLPFYLEYRPDVVLLMTGVHYQRTDADYRRLLRGGVSRDTRWRPFLVIPPMLVELVVFSFASSPLLAARRHPGPQNVAAHHEELESFKTHLRAVIQQIRDSGAHLYLVDYPTPGAPREVQDEIRKIARESGTDYIPLFDLIGPEIAHHLHDQVHPDQEGHRMIAREISRSLIAPLQSLARTRVTRSAFAGTVPGR